MWEQIRANKRRSIAIILAMAALLLLMGYAIGFAVSPEHGLSGVLIALCVWIGLWLVAVSGGSSLILASAGAKEITHDDIPRLFNVVEEMTIAAALPSPPKVYVIDCDAPNAFATGTPEKSSVAVTTGLLSRLNRDELQGVIAHEIGHIKNEDTKFMTLAGVLMGAIVLIADGFARAMFYSNAGRRRSSRSSGKGGGEAQALLMVVALLMAILAPILAQLLYFACSRRREYLADACAARFTRYPEGLASALEKIAGNMTKMKDVNRVTAPMYIINPLQGRSMASLFSTHPATEDRIKVLRGMDGGSGYGQYERAFERVSGGKLLSGDTVKQADDAAIRAPSAGEEAGALTKTREAVDVLHRMGGYLFLQCACGLKMKIPPSYKEKAVTCPRCGVEQAIPMAAVAATAAALEMDGEGGLLSEGAQKETAPEPVYRFRRGKWQSFRCSCGKTIQLSPSFSSDSARCRSCGRETRVVRG